MQLISVRPTDGVLCNSEWYDSISLVWFRINT
jgi:hypothetical protein